MGNTLKGKSDTLMAVRPCGCMSHCIKEDLSDPAFMSRFYKAVAKTGYPVIRIKPGKPFEWECEKHKRERVNRKKQSEMFNPSD